MSFKSIILNKLKEIFLLSLFIVNSPMLYGLDYKFGKAKKFTVPIREISIIATDEGYYPEGISVFAGEKIRFFLTTTSNTPSCLIISEKELYITVSKGNVSEGTVFFDRPSQVRFYCPTNKIKGRLSIIKRPRTAEEVLNARRRSIASKNKVKIWYPKEE